jgi:membrane peptidoglycan carboxypeptidase
VAAALENGYRLDYTTNAPVRAVTKYRIDPRSPAACNGPYYCPTNAGDSMAGTHNMWSAFGRSVNTYFVPLQEKVGAEKVVDVAKRLGVKFRAENDASIAASNPNQWGSFTLGVSATTPLDIANAWATLAADGKYCEPTPVLQIIDRNGNNVPAGDPKCKDVIAPEVARGAIDAARCPVGDHSSVSKCSGGTASGVRGLVARPVAGKTGTTNDEMTATMTITTKQLAVSGFIVDPDWPTHENIGDHPIINNSVAYTLQAAMAGKPSVEFTPPPSNIVHGAQAGVPSVKCATVDAAKKTLSRSGFKPSNNNRQVASDCPAGTVAGTDPSGKASKDSDIELLISSGPGNAIPGGDGPKPPGRR